MGNLRSIFKYQNRKVYLRLMLAISLASFLAACGESRPSGDTNEIKPLPGDNSNHLGVITGNSFSAYLLVDGLVVSEEVDVFLKQLLSCGADADPTDIESAELVVYENYGRNNQDDELLRIDVTEEEISVGRLLASIPNLHSQLRVGCDIFLDDGTEVESGVYSLFIHSSGRDGDANNSTNGTGLLH